MPKSHSFVETGYLKKYVNVHPIDMFKYYIEKVFTMSVFSKPTHRYAKVDVQKFNTQKSNRYPGTRSPISIRLPKDIQFKVFGLLLDIEYCYGYLHPLE